MNNLGSEVIIKVKEAIRAKLKEMKANSSDEIIDYIMLLVTTKKSSSELAKSIDFVMENNTTVFVKWLSTIIKKLQQVTVSTINKNVSENLQIPNEKDQTNDVLICETSDVKQDNSDEEKEKIKSSLNDEDVSIQAFNGKKKKKSSPELNTISKSTKYDENKLSSSSDKLKEINRTICFSPTENIKFKNCAQINKLNNIEQSPHKIRNISIKNDSKMITNSDVVNISNNNEDDDYRRKRPRISINSDDEDEKNDRLKLPMTQTTNQTAKQITKELPRKNIIKSKSRSIVVKPLESKKDIHETKKKAFMHDLIIQRVDHQRGALALDTAFKYIQQQIGASDKEIAVIQKWRDYAVDMLRSSKEI